METEIGRDYRTVTRYAWLPVWSAGAREFIWRAAYLAHQFRDVIDPSGWGTGWVTTDRTRVP
jgi:hypothetical protein